MAKDSRLLDWHTFLEDKCFTNQLHQAASIVLILALFCEINFISFTCDACHLNLKVCWLQGFSDLSLMSGDLVAILHKAQHHLGWEISCDKIEQGQLQELLIADDYMVPSEISKLKTCYYICYYLLFQ